MRSEVIFIINGATHRAGGDAVFQTLSRYLRYEERATGTKIVCEEGDCGACTVLVGRREIGGIRYRPLNSCIQFLFQLDGTHIVTVEGLSKNGLTPLQESMVRCHGAQCGYCTPGFIMAMAVLWEGPRASGLGPRNVLPEMTPLQETAADYNAMELTTGRHLLEHYRKTLKKENVLTAADLKRIPTGRRVTTAGAVIVRQRPGTAKGFVFLTLEDETGMSQAIISPPLFREHRSTILGNSGLIVEGILQNTGGQCSRGGSPSWKPSPGASGSAAGAFPA